MVGLEFTNHFWFGTVFQYALKRLLVYQKKFCLVLLLNVHIKVQCFSKNAFRVIAKQCEYSLLL